jgi:hypothetical protein
VHPSNPKLETSFQYKPNNSQKVVQNLLGEFRLSFSFFRLLPMTLHQVADVADAQEGKVVKHFLNLRVGQADKKLCKKY